MSAFAVDDVVTVAKLRQKILTVDTGAALGSITTFAGMLVFCTVTGGAFTVGRLYQRNEGNTAWLEIADLTSTQTITGKSVSGSTNTITNLGTSAFSDDAVATAKLASAITAYAQASSSSSFSTTGAVDVLSVAITAHGNRSGLVTQCISNFDGDAGRVKIRDGANAILVGIWLNASGTASRDRFATIAQYSGAPSAGSLTRKATFEANTGTRVVNPGTLTKGVILACYEVL